MNFYKVLFQGENFSFGHLAAKKFVDLYLKKTDTIYFQKVPEFSDLFEALEKKIGDFAVLPTENSLAGTVILNYDMLYKYPAKICGEIVLPIKMQLLGLKNSKIENIKKVYSHHKALEQCQKFLLNYPKIQKIEVSNTAFAAKKVSKSNNSQIAAIASTEASLEYNLKILKKDIQDDQNNWTRFAVLHQKSQNPFFDQIFNRNQSINQNSNLILKTAIAYNLARDQTGTLSKSLEFFAQNQLNLTNIESRPIGGKFFEYIFYVDIQTSFDKQKNLQKALTKLSKFAKNLKILGIYHKYSD
jgi:prephenate dehydratase